MTRTPRARLLGDRRRSVRAVPRLCSAPYRVRRGGMIGKAVDEAVDEAVAAADPGNPVTDVTVAGSVLTVTYADGSTVERELPEGGDGGGVAQAVADAQAAQAVAETARAAAQACRDQRGSCRGERRDSESQRGNGASWRCSGSVGR